MPQQDITLYEVMEFLKDNMVTKGEFGVLQKDVTDIKQDVVVIKQDISEIKIRLDNIENELEDIKASIAKLEKKTQEDDDAVISEIENLKKRVSFLEQELKVRQMQPA
mgnify:CR=1 FL=1